MEAGVLLDEEVVLVFLLGEDLLEVHSVFCFQQGPRLMKTTMWRSIGQGKLDTFFSLTLS